MKAQPHGSKNPVVLYQEMWLQRWLRVSKLLSAATSQRFNGQVPVLEHETFSRTVLGTPRACTRSSSYLASSFVDCNQEGVRIYVQRFKGRGKHRPQRGGVNCKRRD